MILSAPSGCGKTTILDRLLARHVDWMRSISVTTRPPRAGEKKGEDYEFVSLDEFGALEKKKQFLEWAEVFSQRYGTRRSVVEKGVQEGKTVLLAIDVQGSRTVGRVLKGKISLLSLFILPPSIPVLRERLQKRNTEVPEEIERRIKKAEEEIKAAQEYDHTVVNRDLDQTVHEIEGLISEFEKKLKEKEETKWPISHSKN